MESDLFASEQSFSRTDTGDEFELKTYGLDLQNTSSFSDTFSATYGINFRFTESYTFFHDWEDVRGNEEETSLGLFAQAEWTPSDFVSLSFGGRYDHYDFTALDDGEFDSGKFSPNATFTLTPLEGLEASFGYSEAYRGVGIREVYLPFGRPEGLDGEEADNIDVALKYERDGFYVQARYFNQNIDNFIYPIAFGRGGANGSFGDIKNEGYEAIIGYNHDDFYVSLSVTDNEPTVEGYDFTDDIGLVAAGRLWTATAGYNFDQYGVTVGASVNHRERVDEEPIAGGGRFPAVAAKGSYTTVDAFARWEVSQIEGLTVQLNVDNLFGEQFQEHTIFASSGLQSPGRQIRVGATYEF